jgi:hypothetical protein
VEFQVQAWRAIRRSNLKSFGPADQPSGLRQDFEVQVGDIVG